MKLSILLLLLGVCVISAKYIPHDISDVKLLSRIKRSDSDESTPSNEYNSNESLNDDDDDGDSNEKLSAQIAKLRLKEEEYQRKITKKREQAERKQEERRQKEEMKEQERLEKEERKRVERLEKQRRKEEEEHRKNEEKLQRSERKREKSIQKQLKELKNDLVQNSDEDFLNTEEESSIEIGDIWRNHIYVKYGLGLTSTRLEKHAAINKYLQEELGLNANSTSNERRQAILNLIRTKLNSDPAAQELLRKQLLGHLNAVAIQKVRSDLENDIEELNNKTELLSNVNLLWADQAKAQIEEKRNFLLTVAQFLSNMLPNWISSNDSQNSASGPSNSNDPINISRSSSDTGSNKVDIGSHSNVGTSLDLPSGTRKVPSSIPPIDTRSVFSVNIADTAVGNNPDGVATSSTSNNNNNVDLSAVNNQPNSSGLSSDSLSSTAQIGEGATYSTNNIVAASIGNGQSIDVANKPRSTTYAADSATDLTNNNSVQPVDTNQLIDSVDVSNTFDSKVYTGEGTGNLNNNAILPAAKNQPSTSVDSSGTQNTTTLSGQGTINSNNNENPLSGNDQLIISDNISEPQGSGTLPAQDTKNLDSNKGISSTSINEVLNSVNISDTLGSTTFTEEGSVDLNNNNNSAPPVDENQLISSVDTSGTTIDIRSSGQDITNLNNNTEPPADSNQLITSVDTSKILSSATLSGQDTPNINNNNVGVNPPTDNSIPINSVDPNTLKSSTMTGDGISQLDNNINADPSINDNVPLSSITSTNSLPSEEEALVGNSTKVQNVESVPESILSHISVDNKPSEIAVTNENTSVPANSEMENNASQVNISKTVLTNSEGSPLNSVVSPSNIEVASAVASPGNIEDVVTYDLNGSYNVNQLPIETVTEISKTTLLEEPTPVDGISGSNNNEKSILDNNGQLTENIDPLNNISSNLDTRTADVNVISEISSSISSLDISRIGNVNTETTIINEASYSTDSSINNIPSLSSSAISDITTEAIIVNGNVLDNSTIVTGSLDVLPTTMIIPTETVITEILDTLPNLKDTQLNSTEASTESNTTILVETQTITETTSSQPLIQDNTVKQENVENVTNTIPSDITIPVEPGAAVVEITQQ